MKSFYGFTLFFVFISFSVLGQSDTIKEKTNTISIGIPYFIYDNWERVINYDDYGDPIPYYYISYTKHIGKYNYRIGFDFTSSLYQHGCTSSAYDINYFDVGIGIQKKKNISKKFFLNNGFDFISGYEREGEPEDLCFQRILKVGVVPYSAIGYNVTYSISIEGETSLFLYYINKKEHIHQLGTGYSAIRNNWWMFASPYKLFEVLLSCSF